MIKMFNKLGTEGNFPNLIKCIYLNPPLTLYSMVKDWKFSPKINKTRMPASTTAIQHCTGAPARAVGQEQETKGIKLKRKKQSYLHSQMTWSHVWKLLKNLQKTIKTNKFSKVAGYTINTQKPVAFLQTNNERSGNEIKKNIPLTTASKRTTHLEINLTKKVQDWYAVNYKTLLNGRKIHGKTFLVRRLKSQYFETQKHTPKRSTDSIAISIKAPTVLFCKYGKINL